MTKIYMSVEFWGVDDTGPRELLHSATATAEELATHFKDFRGREHIVTGYFTEAEVAHMSLTDRGMAHLEDAIHEVDDRPEWELRTGYREEDMDI